MNSELWPHQQDALQRLRMSIGSGKRRPMVQAPTGFGKTLLAAAIVEGATKKGRRVIFTVPAISLVDQTVQAFWNEGIRDVGVIQGYHEMSNFDRPVQVCGVQTLMKRTMPAADVAVIDEAHRWFDFYRKWMAEPEWANKPIIGLSATPWTRGLGSYYDELIIAATTQDLIQQGYLSQFRVFAPSHPDLTGVRTVAGDFHEGDLSTAMNKSPLIADVVETWLRRGEGRPTLCFGVDRVHAKHLQTKFDEAGVRTAYIDAFTKPAERNEIAGRFRSGDVQVVCNVGCLTTGVDWDVRCIILARPTKSEMLFVQIIGRGLRTADGKADCLVLDHSDTHLRLGFVTDINHQALNTGRERTTIKQGRVLLPKECPQCAFLKPAKVQICPACGHKAEPVAAETVDGELEELTPKRVEATHEIKQKWYSMLLRVAAERGYKSGWAANQYRQKFKVWPRGLSECSIEPNAEVLSYIKSSMIRYAKARKAA